jgi:hypothetical protein
LLQKNAFFAPCLWHKSSIELAHLWSLSHVKEKDEKYVFSLKKPEIGHLQLYSLKKTELYSLKKPEIGHLQLYSLKKPELYSLEKPEISHPQLYSQENSHEGRATKCHKSCLP